MKNIVLVGGHDQTFTHFAGLGFEFSVLQRPVLIAENLRALTDEIHPVRDFEPDTVAAEIERIIQAKRRPGRMRARKIVAGPWTNQDKVGWIVIASNERGAFHRAVDYLDEYCS